MQFPNFTHWVLAVFQIRKIYTLEKSRVYSIFGTVFKPFRSLYQSKKDGVVFFANFRKPDNFQGWLDAAMFCFLGSGFM